MGTYTTYYYDIVIVGAGGAGLRAAIEARKDPTLKVAVICKSLLGKAHTVMAEGGMAAALGNVDSGDNWQVHFRDTMKGGKFLNNYKMAEIHAKEAPERVRDLEQWGAVFDRSKDGFINQRPFGGHTYPRLAHVGDRTGLEMIRTLQDTAVHSGMEVFMEYTVVKLFTENGGVTGLLAYNRHDGEFFVFQAKAIILATGGCARAFAVQTNSWEGTGDGQALAFLAGADMIDMEFMQFHPTGMVWPLSVAGILVTEGVRGEGGILKNSNGKRFMFNYIPETFKNDVADSEAEAKRWVEGDQKNNRRPPELLTRDVVARAINSEVKAGRGSPHGGVFLDIASEREAEYIKRKLPSMYHQFKELADVDITKEPMEIGPTAHYIMGGVRVNPETTESSIKGLLACGEVAAGLHGANRLGGNSLTDLLVFGKRAGEYAAKLAKQSQTVAKIDEAIINEAIEETLKPFSVNVLNSENPYQLQNELRQMMHEQCGIIRRKEEMETALEKLTEFKKRAVNMAVIGDRKFNMAWHSVFDVRNLLLVSELLARAALSRKESRGAHTREDYPESDKEWGKKNIILRRKEEGVEVVCEPVEEMREELKGIIEKLE